MWKQILTDITFLTISITVLAAIVHATNQFKIARDNKDPFTLLDFAICIPASILAACLFGAIAITLSGNEWHVLIAAGTGSYLGITGVNAVTSTVLKVLVKKYEDK